MINVKKIRPLFQAIVTTAHKWAIDELDDTGIVTDIKKTAGALKEYQTVVAVGDFVKNIKPGDIVCINPDNYAVHRFKENSMKGDLMENTVDRYNFNVVELDGIPHLLLTDRDIRYIIEEFEEVKESPIIQPNSDIIFS